ncbi:MAG TPA: hypothetical protein VGT79_08435 [Xanthomonadaceae bacterium]|nr:hypothetical protein [Xanthomonadaceae bacterium]HEV2619586.1 hypothetical protein [Acidobacteriaceae bacterium]
MNPIDEAAAVYELAKMQHERTAEALSDAHTALVALMPTKDEGAVTVSGESYKVAITYGMNRTVDAAALAAIKDSVPAALFEQAITYKPSIVLAGLRYLSSNEPDAYAALAQAITARPAKPSVKIEAIADEARLAA